MIDLLVISILPVILVGLFIYIHDKDKEPTKLLVKLFLGGVGSCFITLLLTFILQYIFPFFGSSYSSLNYIELFIYVFIGIALVEEFSKWIITYKISFNDSAFDQLYDAIIYGVFVALGFACFENILYVFQGGMTTGIVRAIFAVPGHAFDGMFMGYYLGLAKSCELHGQKELRNKNLFLSILIPTITHGIYDYCLFTENGFFVLLFFAFVIFMYIYVIKHVKKVSSITIKMKYNNNYCTVCGRKVESDFCPTCGNKNE